MARVPSALWVVDTKKEHIAVSEARKLGIPVIAILDTNCDPDEVDLPDPGERRRDPQCCPADQGGGRRGRGRADRPGRRRAGGRGEARAGATASSARPSRWPSGSASCSRAGPQTAREANGSAPRPPAQLRPAPLRRPTAAPPRPPPAASRRGRAAPAAAAGAAAGRRRARHAAPAGQRRGGGLGPGWPPQPDASDPQDEAAHRRLPRRRGRGRPDDRGTGRRGCGRPTRSRRPAAGA